MKFTIEKSLLRFYLESTCEFQTKIRKKEEILKRKFLKEGKKSLDISVNFIYIWFHIQGYYFQKKAHNFKKKSKTFLYLRNTDNPLISY